MSKASDYIEKWNDANRLQPMVRYTKGIVRENEADTGFNAVLMGDGTVIISQHESGEEKRIITMDLPGAKKFTEWIWRIVKED